MRKCKSCGYYEEPKRGTMETIPASVSICKRPCNELAEPDAQACGMWKKRRRRRKK